MQIDIKSEQIETIPYKDKKSGEAKRMRKQFGYVAFKDKPYPVEIKINLNDDQAAYPVGLYDVDVEACIEVDKRYDSLRLKYQPVMQPVKSVRAA